MSDEAKEIERLELMVRGGAPATAALMLAALARRLLEERDAAREWAVKSVREVEARERIMTCIWCAHEYPPMTPKAQAPILYEHAKVCEKNPARQLEQRIASLEREVASYEGMDRAVTHYQDVKRLERELEEARQKHNDHCRTTEVCYFSEKWRK